MEIALILKDSLALVYMLSVSIVFFLPLYIWARFESRVGLVLFIIGLCWLVLLFAAPVAEVTILKDGRCERTAWVGSFQDGEKRFKLRSGYRYVYGSPDSGPYELAMYAVAYTEKKEKVGSPVPSLPPCEPKTIDKGELWEVPLRIIYMFREPESKQPTFIHGDKIVWYLDRIEVALEAPAVYKELDYEVIDTITY